MAAHRRGGVKFFSRSVSVAFKQMPVAMLGHPYCAREMTLPGAPCPLGFTGWIDVQHDSRHFRPIGAFSVGIKQAQIRHEMFVVVILALRKCLNAGGLAARLDYGRD
jgi:hypothetical protein